MLRVANTMYDVQTRGPCPQENTMLAIFSPKTNAGVAIVLLTFAAAACQDATVGNPSNLPTNKHALGRLLEDPNLSAETLHQIASLPSPALHKRMMGSGQNRKGLAVMRLVARHPNVEEQTLVLLAKSSDEYVRADVAMNSKTPVDILYRFYVLQRDYLMEWGLAYNKNTPADILHDLATSPNEYTRSDVAKNPGTPIADLEKLVKDPVWHVRRGVVMNPKAPPDLLDPLRNDPDERVRNQFGNSRKRLQEPTP